MTPRHKRYKKKTTHYYKKENRQCDSFVHSIHICSSNSTYHSLFHSKTLPFIHSFIPSWSHSFMAPFNQTFSHDGLIHSLLHHTLPIPSLSQQTHDGRDIILRLSFLLFSSSLAWPARHCQPTPLSSLLASLQQLPAGFFDGDTHSLTS